jgi:anti-anti-sigma regulatory factor
MIPGWDRVGDLQGAGCGWLLSRGLDMSEPQSIVPASGVCVVAGEVIWRETAALREALFDLLEAPGHDGLTLDVRAVTRIDRTGVALLIGANHRAAALGHPFTLIDAHGPVTRVLSGLRMLGDFEVTQVPRD